MTDHSNQSLSSREMVRSHAYPVLATVSSLSLIGIVLLLLPQAVSHHIKVLRETKDQSMEAYSEHPEQKRTKTVRPVEKKNPLTWRSKCAWTLLMLNQQEQGEPDEEALFRCWSPMMATIPGTAR